MGINRANIRLLLCPNAFKGSLTAPEAARAMAAGIARITRFPPESKFAELKIEVRQVPLADGGDGTLETLVSATQGEIFTATAQNPLGQPIAARWGRLGGLQRDTAVIEMAEAAGLRLLTPAQYDPENAATYGVGQLMRIALEAGCRTLILGIGGSATNDGGAGMAQALGARFLDANGRDIAPGGASLLFLTGIERNRFILPPEIRVIAACDVDNPLTGPEGAAFVYGPQKGATSAQAEKLDAALAHYGEILFRETGRDIAGMAGAGAAGGLGAGLLAFCNAELRPGIDLVMEAAGFDAALTDCDLVFTGEGRLDGQTGRGKVIAGVAKRAKAAGIPVIALVGSLADGAEAALRPEGLTAAFPILDAPQTVEAAMRDAYRLLEDAAERALRLLLAREAAPE